VKTWAVIATGASLLPAPELVARKVAHLPTVAVSDAFRIAPWAKALIACDGKWWRANFDALRFPGEKWCANGVQMVPRYPQRRCIGTTTNSGLLGIDCAIRLGADRVLVLGVDMKGTHYFGPHRTLPNTTPKRFAELIEQFENYARQCSAEVINCNRDSALDVFPKMTLDEALALDEVAEAA
jgi:hypothetical protein